MDYLNDLHEMCDTIAHELSEANDKIRQSGGKLSGSDLDYVDKLTHAMKSIKTTIAMMEADDGGSYYDGGYHAMRGGSYARGRNGYSRRMGRYSRTGYSRDADMIDELRDLIHDAPEALKGDIQRLISKAEQM